MTPSHQVTVCRDPKDNMYLELALSGKADCIVTGDIDLPALHPFHDVAILTPFEFLRQTMTSRRPRPVTVLRCYSYFNVVAGLRREAFSVWKPTEIKAINTTARPASKNSKGLMLIL